VVCFDGLVVPSPGFCVRKVTVIKKQLFTCADELHILRMLVVISEIAVHVMLAETKMFAAMCLCTVVVPSVLTGMVYHYDGESKVFETQEEADYSKKVMNGKAVYYDLWDGMNQCRDRVYDLVDGPKRNVTVDNRSSHYDKKRQQYVVYIYLDVVGKKKWFSKRAAYEGLVVCKTDATSNRVKYFRLKAVDEA